MRGGVTLSSVWGKNIHLLGVKEEEHASARQENRREANDAGRRNQTAHEEANKFPPGCPGWPYSTPSGVSTSSGSQALRDTRRFAVQKGLADMSRDQLAADDALKDGTSEY